MARRRNRKDQRDASVIPSEQLLVDRHTIVAPLRLPVSPLPHNDPFFDDRSLIDLEDRREFDFDSEPEFMNTDASPASVQVVHAPERKGAINNIGRMQAAFVRPDRVAVCVRRHERREVLFALRRRGRGGGRRRRNDSSNIRC